MMDLNMYSEVWNNTTLLYVKMVSISLGIANSGKGSSLTSKINVSSQDSFYCFYLCSLLKFLWQDFGGN